MGLKACKECKKEVSSEAKVCPHCGVKGPADPPARQVFGAFVLVIIVGWVIVSIFGEDKDSESCREDLVCLAEKAIYSAGHDCTREIERRAKYAFEWTDGLLETKLARYRWSNKKQGIIEYMGDDIRFQNGFGAWVNMAYYCKYNALTEKVVGVEVKQGRL